MESTTDIELEELESRLYSQVFHSTENWDLPSNAQNPVSENSNNAQTPRHVSTYSVNKKQVSGKRYWDAKINYKQQNIASTDNRTFENENPITASPSVKNTLVQQNSSALESIIPLETNPVIEYRTKKLWYKKIAIPTTFKLPRYKVKNLPDNIIKYFKLNSKIRKKNFRSFLRFIEKSQRNNNTEQILNDIDAENRTTIEKSPLKITITTNGIDSCITLSDIPIPTKNDDTLILPNKEDIKNVDNDIITLSDSESDTDSVIEIPLPPIPVYNVDSSSESESETQDESVSNNVACSPKNNVIEELDANISESKDGNEEQSLAKRNENIIETVYEINSKNTNQPVDLNESFAELEKDRDDFLRTPDSNTNDFLEHDNTLNKSSFSFNFGLHSSDLDLSKDKEELNPKPGPSANYHDLYETESSCSEIGSVILKSRPVFNEVNFENPMKDIFCEPDLSKFSNFITPNRNTKTRSKKSKIRSNTVFAPVLTKACEKNSNEEEEIDSRRSRSNSSEYHSDPTTLKVKKKNKKAKRRAKKKDKPNNSELCPSPTKELQTEENNFEDASTFQVAEINSKPSINPAAIHAKSPSPSKQIENLKFGPSSLNDEINSDKEKIAPENSEQGNSASPSSSNRKRYLSITDYYVDTYFADDCIIYDDMRSINIRTETYGEPRNDTSSPTIIVDDINSKELIPINTASTSDHGVNFSFVDTWRKSSDKNVNNEEETTPTKKLKTDQAATVQPYIVSLISSEDDDSKSSEISVGGNPLAVTVDLDDDSSCPELVLVNVETNKPKKNFVANPFSFVETYQQNKEKKSFKDFKTNDLTKFYENSWGQENFDLDKAQSSMSDNDSDWKVVPADIVRYSPRKRGPLCLKCKEFGHTQYKCPRFRGPIKCSTCGTAGHSYTRCPKSVCTTCRNPSNHLTIKCGHCTHFNTIHCGLCNNVGHEMMHCPDLWRRYHLTTESNTELNTSSSVLKSPSERWCSNCAKRGHCEDKCTSLGHEHFPTTPGIISYVPSYDEVFKLPVAPPAPNIPIFKEANVTMNDLRTLKKDVIQSSNQKYMNILKQLRQQCNKYDLQLINQIDRLRRNINNEVFSKKKIQAIHRIRARVARNKIS